MVREGKLFVLEGPDGSGKSTMVHHLVDRITNSGFYTEGVALPNQHSKLHDEIRDCLKSEKVNIDSLQLMMIQNMDDCFSKIIIPKLEQGINIILDRWAISTIIYNLINEGNLINNDFLTNQNEIDLERIVRKTSCFKWPDKIFYLNTPKNLVMDNSIKRYNNNIEVFDRSDAVFMVYDAYQEFMKAVVDKKRKFMGHRIYEFVTSSNKDRHMIINPEYGFTMNNSYLSMEDKIFFEMIKGVGVA